MPPLLRLIHPAPAAAVVTLTAALAIILAGDEALAGWWRIALVVAAVAGSQVVTGALNDWADRGRDATSGQAKPIPAGLVTPAAALRLAIGGAVLQLVASLPLGPAFAALGALATLSAVAYDVWLSRTPLSVLPYLVSFGVLPLWIATGVGAPATRVLGAVPLAAAFAGAAHLANTLRDWDTDATSGSRCLAQVLGRRPSRVIASGVSLGVGLGVGAALLLGGRVSAPVAASGLIGLAAVAGGAVRERWLWRGQLVAAVAWTVAWALSGAGT